jgi:hypothetical protein
MTGDGVACPCEVTMSPFFVAARFPTVSPVVTFREVKKQTWFHPVWDISYQEPRFRVQILRLHRFDQVPM